MTVDWIKILTLYTTPEQSGMLAIGLYIIKVYYIKIQVIF